MANVIMTVRVMPESLEVKLDVLKKKVFESLKDVAESKVGINQQPIAFGLEALDVTLVVPEDKGGLVEDKLSAIKGVQTVMVQSVSLV